MVTMQPQAITKVSISALVISLPIIYVSLLRVPPSTLARDSTFWFLMSNSIIAIIAADSGMLFLGSTSHHHHHDDLSDVVPGDEQAANVHEDYHSDAMLLPLPLMPSSHEPTVPVDISYVAVGGGEQLPPSGSVSSKAADTAAMEEEEGHAPALIQGKGAAGKPTTDMVGNHASVLQRCEEEAPDLEPTTASKDDEEMIVKGEHYTISPAPLMTVTPDDHVQQDEGSVQVVREEVKPRWCSVTVEKDREYWRLSDEELNRKVEEFITRFNRDMIEQEAAAV
ncbi:hypothetical protein ACQ4PT_058365 [Festuca glaucescens]